MCQYNRNKSSPQTEGKIDNDRNYSLEIRKKPNSRSKKEKKKNSAIVNTVEIIVVRIEEGNRMDDPCAVQIYTHDLQNKRKRKWKSTKKTPKLTRKIKELSTTDIV